LPQEPPASQTPEQQTPDQSVESISHAVSQDESASQLSSQMSSQEFPSQPSQVPVSLPQQQNLVPLPNTAPSKQKILSTQPYTSTESQPSKQQQQQLPPQQQQLPQQQQQQQQQPQPDQEHPLSATSQNQLLPQVVLNREPVQLHPDSEYHVSEGIITLLFSLIVVNESLQKNISVVKQKGEIVENEKSIFL